LILNLEQPFTLLPASIYNNPESNHKIIHTALILDRVKILEIILNTSKNILSNVSNSTEILMFFTNNSNKNNKSLKLFDQIVDSAKDNYIKN
jgi:hypothetical protein